MKMWGWVCSVGLTNLDVPPRLPQEMEARFLAGEDSEFVDYADIDADQQLDDHWIEQRGRDAEDAYFNEDGGGTARGHGRSAAEGFRGPDECPSGTMQDAESEHDDGMVAEAVAEEETTMAEDAEELEEWERMAQQYEQDLAAPALLAAGLQDMRCV